MIDWFLRMRGEFRSIATDAELYPSYDSAEMKKIKNGETDKVAPVYTSIIPSIETFMNGLLHTMPYI